MDSGMYKPVQLAAAKALGNPKSWYDSINAEYASRRELVYRIFDLLGATYDKAQTGMFLWARIPDSYADAYEFSDLFLYQAHVFLTPGTIFGSNGKNYARISLCSSKEQLKEAYIRLQKVVETVKN